VYYNSVRVHSEIRPESRYVGNALVYAADSFYEPAIATLSSFDFQPHSSTNPADPEAARIEAVRVESLLTSSSFLSGARVTSFFGEIVLNKPLARNTLVGTASVPKNFVLNMTIAVAAVRPEWANIIHFTSNDKDYGVLGSRSPGLWFAPGTSKLLVVIGTTADANRHFYTPALPLNQKTLVTVYAVDQYITVYYNSVRVHSEVSPEPRCSN
jgi:hypothetical protein